MNLLPFIHFKYLLIEVYGLSILYVHLRGKVRLGFFRQLTDHSSLLAPINAVLYLFSSVPKTPYIALHHFPELHILRDNWQEIRKEAEWLYQNGYMVASDKQDDIGFNSFFRRGWKRFYLKWYNNQPPSALELCPNTLKLVESIPGINAAMFALLPKKSFLFQHRDPYAGSLRYHLGLITPNSDACSICVDGQSYSWRDGEDVLFDETFVHSAKNETDQDRIILFCDIKRPLTNMLANKFNQLFSNTVMKAAASKNLPTEKIGFINRSFKYLYQIRMIGKRLKAFHKPTYYLIKYLLLFALLCGLFKLF